MKTILHILLFISVAVITGCTDSKTSQGDIDKTEKKAVEQESKTPQRIKKSITVTGEFFQITNISSAVIDFTTGPFNIVAEGDSISLSHISYDIDGGILTISTPMDISNDIHNYPVRSDVVVHVSCPDLRTIANCSGGGFTCHETLRSEKIELGGLVGGSIDIDSVECHSFRYQSNGSTSLNIGNINCEECVIISTGTGCISLNATATTNTYIDAKGSTTMRAEITSPLTEGIIETEGSVSYTLQSDELKLVILRGTVDLSGTAKVQDIKCEPQAIVNNRLKR